MGNANRNNNNNNEAFYQQEEARLTTNVNTSDTSFSLSFSALSERPKHKIMSGYLKKVGKRLAGTHTRWVVIYTSFELETCKSEQAESIPSKRYSLINSKVQFGKLATGEFAIKINTQIEPNTRARKKDQITLLFHNRREMQQWIGGIRCMFAGTENDVVNSSSMGGESCTICIDDFVHGQILTILPCNHRFCPNCIKQWLDISTLCPCCKQDAMIDDILMYRTGKYNKEIDLSLYQKKRSKEDEDEYNDNTTNNNNMMAMSNNYKNEDNDLSQFGFLKNPAATTRNNGISDKKKEPPNNNIKKVESIDMTTKTISDNDEIPTIMTATTTTMEEGFMVKRNSSLNTAMKLDAKTNPFMKKKSRSFLD